MLKDLILHFYFKLKFDFYFSLCNLMFRQGSYFIFRIGNRKIGILMYNQRERENRIVYIFIHNSFPVHRTG